MSPAVSSSLMVGRGDELALLQDALREGASGEARAVLIRGEAGIGKTRLLEEFLGSFPGTAAPDLPVAISRSQCLDMGPIGAPLTPIRRMLRDLYASVGDEAFRAAAASTQVLSTLGAVIPEFEAGSTTQFDGGDDRLAEAIERVIEGLSAHVHLVLVIEDLHWADDATLALLRTLATTLRGKHLTLVMNYRMEDVGRGHPLRAVLSELERSRSLVSITLRRLDRDEIAAQSTQILGREPTADELDTLEQRSEGVPFYVEELLGIPGDELPDTLRDVVLARYERLDDTARRVVDIAAVAGLRVDHELLAGAWDGTELDLRDGLRSGITAGVLAAQGESYGFRHALIQEAVYEDLLPHARSELHTVFGRGLQARVEAGEESYAAAAADHWLAANATEAAFVATVAARRYARREFAPGTAAELGERLLALWPHVKEADSKAEMGPLALRLEIATDHHRAHQMRACLRVIDDALRLAPVDDADSRIPFLELLVQSGTDRRADIVAHLDEIDRLLGDRDDDAAQAQRARSLAKRARYTRSNDRLEVASRAVELARTMDDRDLLSETLRFRSMARDSFSDSVHELQESLALTPVPSTQGLYSANALICTYIWMGKYDEAIEAGRAAYEAATAAGLERAGAQILANTGEVLIAVGEFDEGIAAARRAAGLTRGDSYVLWLNAIQIESIGRIWNDQLDDYDQLMANDLNSAAATASADPHWVCELGRSTIDAAVTRARSVVGPERLEGLQTVLPLLEPLSSASALVAPEDFSDFLVSAAILVREIVEAGGTVADDDIANIRAVTGALAEDPWFDPIRAIVAAHVATAESAVPSVPLWRDAVASTTAHNVPRRYIHYTRFQLGRALLRNNEREEAVATLRRVVDEATQDHVNLVARWARETLEGLGKGRSSNSGPFGSLTAREIEVLSLVAEGLTNGEIGKKLFISAKTASVHVSAILAKLGASNRAEAASLYASATHAGPGQSR